MSAPTSITTTAAADIPPMESVTLSDSRKIRIRPVDPSDVERERRFILGLSPQSRRMRFLDTMNEPSERLLRGLTHIAPGREAALIALEAERDEIVGVARYSAGSNGDAEVAVVVSDAWQHHGIGIALMSRLIDIARQRGVERLISVDPNSNYAMQRFAQRLGFRSRSEPDDPTMICYTLPLT